jgi:hypothetical protein
VVDAICGLALDQAGESMITVKRYIRILAIPFSLLFAGTAWAQKVSKSIPDKGWVLATFEYTSSVKAGQFACFLDDAGTTVACGKIIKVSKTVVVVKTTPLSAAAQVKPGFKVEISATQPASVTVSAKEKKSGKKSGVGNLRLVTAPGMGVASIAKVTYLPPAIGASGVSLWGPTNKRIEAEKVSIGVEYDHPGYGVFGVRYVTYGDASGQFASTMVLQTDYGATNKQLYVEAAHTMTAYGSYYDYVILRPSSNASRGFRVSAGVDFLTSVANLEADLHDDSDGSSSGLASLKSSLSVISLRTGVEFAQRIGKTFEMGIGLRALVPLAETGLQQTSMITDNNSGKSLDEQTDIKKALDHKKTTFGLLIPVYMSFKI